MWSRVHDGFVDGCATGGGDCRGLALVVSERLTPSSSGSGLALGFGVGGGVASERARACVV